MCYRLACVIVRAVLALFVATTTVRAADPPLAYADPNPQRYNVTARASEIDPRVKAHPPDRVPAREGRQAAGR